MGLLKNEQGGFLLIVLIFLAVLVTAIVGFFAIKNHEIEVVHKQEQEIKNNLASEQIIQKYLFLTKHGHNLNWRVGALREAYDCAGDSTGMDCGGEEVPLIQTWALRALGVDPPFTVKYKATADSDYQNLPATVTYSIDEAGVISFEPADLFDCYSIRIENIPINTTYCQIELIQNEDEATSANITIEAKVFASDTPLIFNISPS